MSEWAHPKGSRLPALERNILKYRAFEMVLILFYCESLRSFVTGVIGSPRIVPSTKNKLKVALQALLDDGALSANERDEIERLIDYRNDIAHGVEKLTGDIGRSAITQGFQDFMGVKYNHAARKRLHHYTSKLPDRLARRYVIPLSFDALYFEAAERTYTSELARLKAIIDKQYSVRKREDERLRAEVSIGRMTEENDPYHPANKRSSGQLSVRGIGVCYQLFDAGKSPLAVAHMMRISYSAARARYRKWQLAE